MSDNRISSIRQPGALLHVLATAAVSFVVCLRMSRVETLAGQ